MKSLILIMLLPACASAAYKLNPYTNQKDYYESVQDSLSLLTSSVTQQGNTFNGKSQLVKTNSSGLAPVSITGNAATATNSANWSGSTILKAQVDAIAVSTGNISITVGSTTTGGVGSPALVTNSGTGAAAIFNFTIPQGVKGEKGDPGDVSFTSTGTFSGTISMTNLNNVYYGNGNNLTFKKAVFNNLTITGDVRSLNVIQ